ncbi:ABC transporter permease [Bacillus sp. 165]|uniref:ABC transporter permease n=1 Tax=Bacillus sp. 165 TaxID=1529117 RepID=UPI001ADBF887|nr:ABC transporter permease [Bacillus sp. 165]MBO9129497.1 ABC transporter permease [Bacillus sp. 165]
MIRLIKLEWAKAAFGRLFKFTLIGNVLLTFWFIFNAAPNEEYDNYEIVFMDIGSYVRMMYIVIASVLIARVVIDEYKNKTISVLFTYPVPRKKLFIAKVLLICSVTFGLVICSNVIIAIVFLCVDMKFHYIPETLTVVILLREMAKMVIFSIAAVGASLVPLFFGMRRKSVSATTVSAFIVLLVFINTFLISAIYQSWKSSILLSLLWVTMGIGMSYAAIRNLDKEDVE